MTEHIYPPDPDFVSGAHIDAAAYEAMYRQSVEDPEGFWGE
ncbi:acetyl-CoA synthetase-like protein, partial [Rhodovulum visakhapatnamense]